VTDVQDQQAVIAWKTLFGEEFEDIPDPNKPENTAFINAKKKENIERFKRFANGSGRVMFEQWQRELRSGMFELLNTDIECNCVLSMQLYKLQYLLRLIVKAQNIINK